MNHVGVVPLFVALFVATPLCPRGMQSVPSRIPAAIYPPGARISYRPSLTNAQMDCMWGFLCGGNVPRFHFKTQDQLHRLGGWGQFAGVHRRGRITMAFELFVSRYDAIPNAAGTPWSKQAFLDLGMALGAQGYACDRYGTSIRPPSPNGGALVAVQLLGRQDLVVMAVWSGSVAIEGIASYDHRPAARQTAWASLVRQLQLASERSP